MSEFFTLEQLKERANGIPVTIPDWGPDKTITVRCKKPDVMPVIMKAGMVPNQLAKAASDLFSGKYEEKNEEPESKGWEQLFKVLEAVAEACLIEPTFAQFQEHCPLSFEQKMAILSWAMGEQNSLDNFREGARLLGINVDSKNMAVSAE